MSSYRSRSPGRRRWLPGRTSSATGQSVNGECLTPTGYDFCICVHAEQNALLSAARFGGEVEQTVVYSTLKPCFGCLKELLQAKVRAVRYLHEWPQEDPALRAEYLRLLKELPDGVRRVEGMEDPDEEWQVAERSRQTLATHPRARKA